MCLVAALMATEHGVDVFIERPVMMTLAIDLTFFLSIFFFTSFSPFNTDIAVNSEATGVCIEFKLLPSSKHCLSLVVQCR